MRTDRFPALLLQSSMRSLSLADCDLASEERTTRTKELTTNPIAGHISEKEHCNVASSVAEPHVVVLRRSALGERLFGNRKTVSMYGSLQEPQKEQITKACSQDRLGRPHSVCMLAASQSTSLLVTNAGKRDVLQQHRSRRAELRVVDGLKPDMPPSFRLPLYPQQEILARQPLRASRRLRPVSMTVLELKEASGSQRELANRTFSDAASLPRSGFRWRLFGRQAQDKEVIPVSAPTARNDGPKKKFGSLRRTLSLRVRWNRNQPEQDGTRERARASAGEDITRSTRPFSYLTGRTLSPTCGEDDGQRNKQYIEFQSRGRVSVLEVPLAPAKLTKPIKSTSAEPSLWQQITSRFKRKGQSSSNKCEPCAESQPAGRDPPARNKNPQLVAIATLTGVDFNKGQGKLRKIHELRSQSCAAHQPSPEVLHSQKGLDLTGTEQSPKIQADS